MMTDLEHRAISIDEKLSVIIRLLAYQIKEGKKLAEAAPQLKRLGLTNAEIAEVFDSPANAVRARLAEKKRKKRPGANELRGNRRLLRFI